MARTKNDAIKKKQLVRELSERTGITVVQCNWMFEEFIETVRQHVLNEEEVEIKLLGKFYFCQHSPKKSNMTGGMVPAHKQLKFKVAEGIARKIRVSTREQ